MTVLQTVRKGNLGLLTGVLFVVLWLVGTIVQSAKGSGTFPRPTDSMAVVHDYFSMSGSAIKLSGGFQILSAVALLWFAGILATLLQRHVIAVSGAIAAGTQLLSAGAAVALGGSDLVSDPVATQILYQFSFWTGGPIHVAAFGAMVLAAAYSLGTRLPQWLSISGIVIGAAGTLASLTAVVPAAVVFTPIGRFLGFIWILITAILLSIRRSGEV
jgi:hypothetical protein